MKNKQVLEEKINNTIDKVAIYLIYLGALVFIGLPILTRFIEISEWQRTFWLIALLSIFCLLWTLLGVAAIFLRKTKSKKITKGSEKLQKLSPKKARVLSYTVLTIGTLLFAGATYMFIPYTIKGIDYLYIQNKQPVTEIDLVTKARAGTGTSKFTVQNAEFENLGKLVIWFESVRFKEGHYYEITMIPNTKYILERTLKTD